jgi:hypothetical protein
VRIIFHLVAVWTDVVFAHIALPSRRQETSTVVDGTLSHKLLLFLRLLRRAAVTHGPYVVVEDRDLRVHRANLISNGVLKFHHPCDFSTPNKFLLGLGEQTLFALKKYLFSMGLQLSISEGFRARLIDELSVPGVLALHAVGIIDDAYQVPLNALATRFLGAVPALDVNPVFEIERLATYGTRSTRRRHTSFEIQWVSCLIADTDKPFTTRLYFLLLAGELLYLA